MSVNYLDTSALIKRYVAEIGSEWVHELLAYTSIPTAFTSHLTVAYGILYRGDGRTGFRAVNRPGPGSVQ